MIRTTGGEWNPTDYAYHLTRRARGLPLWFSLAVYGLDAYRNAVEAAATLALQTAELIKAAPQLELVREPELGVVLFRRLGWRSGITTSGPTGCTATGSHSSHRPNGTARP